MTQPTQPTEPKPGPELDPTGTTPHGVPDGVAEHEPMARPTSDRAQTETAVQRAGKP